MFISQFEKTVDIRKEKAFNKAYCGFCFYVYEIKFKNNPYSVSLFYGVFAAVVVCSW